ncbi:MAG: PDZ domain-containing protein, partial [Pseudomonadota bacterium]|nr:PDZ domain-containing protein [Pseudomonadota bacterium]
MSQLIFATKKLLIVALIVIAGDVTGHAQENLPEETGIRGNGDGGQLALYEQLTLFGDVLERVRAEYVDAPSDEELIEAALTGMLSSLDPHSAYLPPKGFEDMQIQTRGEFGGLGIEVTMDKGLVKVIAPIDDTPAQRAGMLPNDLISHLDDEPVLGLTLAEAVERM